MLSASDFSSVRLLGRGAASIVELADGPDGRQYALKRLSLRGSALEMETAARRLRREAAVLERLRHPAITPLIGHFHDADDVVLVMPYMGGGSLADQVHQGGPLSVDQAMVLCERLLDAVGFAHSQGVLHRDISPRNVLYDADGTVYLADFGIASDDDATLGLTQTGTVLGTPGSISPEQARGESATPKSDVFSLAATVMWALGTPVFASGDETALNAAARNEIAAAPIGLPAPLRRTLAALLSADPGARPSATEATAMLADPTPDTLRGHRVDEMAVSPDTGTRDRRRMAALALACVLPVVLLAAGWFAWGDDQRGDVAAETTGNVAAAPSTTACESLPFQPCGGPPARNTDGTSCIDPFDNYDSDALNGCEAEPVGEDIESLGESTPVAANLVPRADVDTYELEVFDNPHLLCDGHFRVALRAADGTRQQVSVYDPDGELIDRTTSDGSELETVIVTEGCFTDDSGMFEVVVESMGDDRSAGTYVLTTEGSL